nr:MAG TPA: hypothetical protein [Caudoviricetes sp.]DAT78681.1 MAG TPA: hypothetical protein [Caudoviricetes sp.]DAW72618.1 MAG TPA: hypothetical protein [Herelleviridae sp.]
MRGLTFYRQNQRMAGKNQGAGIFPRLFLPT